MGIKKHEAQSKSERLIQAMEALTRALEQLPEREEEYRRRLAVPPNDWLTAHEMFGKN